MIQSLTPQDSKDSDKFNPMQLIKLKSSSYGYVCLWCLTDRLLHSLSNRTGGNRTVRDMASNWLASAFCDWLFNYRLGLPSATLHFGFTWPMGIPTIFQTPMTVLGTVPLHSPNGRQVPAVRAVQGDCERVYLTDETWNNQELQRSNKWGWTDCTPVMICAIKWSGNSRQETL